MHALLLASVLLPGVLAGGSCPAPRPNSGNGNYAPGPGVSSVATANAHTWTLLSPSEILSSLESWASLTPSAVSILTSVPVSGLLTYTIPTPSGYTTLPQTTPAAATTKPGYSSTPTTMSTATTAAASTGGGYSNSTTTGTSAAASTQSSGAASSTPSTSTSSPSTTSTSTSSTPTSTTCSSPRERVEWRNLTPQQQQAFTDANQCLMLAPPRANFPNCKSRWDELVYIHQQMAPTVHQVGTFLAWHRQFTWTYEQELRTYCQYSGPMVWWDETRDAGNFHSAPMFTSQYFGSANVGSAQCVTNGVYAGITLNIGPGDSDVQHCLARGVNEKTSSAVTQQFVNLCNSYPNFDQMENCQFFGVHAYCHDAIGGVMSDIDSSPGDPIFFCHHAFVDRNWRNWQIVEPSNRTYAIGGYTTQQCINGGPGCTPSTLGETLSTLGYQPDVTVAQVADTQGDHLCYYYDY